MYFSQVTVHSVGLLGIWLVERSQERRRIEQLSSHENVPILTRINESLTSAETKRIIPLDPYRTTQRNKWGLKWGGGGLCRTKNIFSSIKLSQITVQMYQVTKFTKLVKIIKVPRLSVTVIMFPNYHCITANVSKFSKICENFTYVVRSHSTVWLTCHSLVATSLPSYRSVNGQWSNLPSSNSICRL